MIYTIFGTSGMGKSTYLYDVYNSNDNVLFIRINRRVVSDGTTHAMNCRKYNDKIIGYSVYNLETFMNIVMSNNPNIILIDGIEGYNKNNCGKEIFNMLKIISELGKDIYIAAHKFVGINRPSSYYHLINISDKIVDLTTMEDTKIMCKKCNVRHSEVDLTINPTDDMLNKVDVSKESWDSRMVHFCLECSTKIWYNKNILCCE